MASNLSAVSSSAPPSKVRNQLGTGDLTAVGRKRRQRASEYAELRKTIREAGLLEKQPRYYAARIVVNLVLLACSVSLLVLVDNFWLQLLNAPLLAFVFAQVAFIAHNSGHRGVGTAAWQDEWITMTHMGLLLGVSASWWVDKHNEHHGHPNVLDMDPDIEFPVIAFTEEQAQSKRSIFRWIVAYQAYLFPLMVTLVPWNMRVHSVRKLLSGTARRPFIEGFFMLVHLVGYAVLLYTTLGVGQGLLFAMVHHSLIGIYLASVFAANHKGMPILDKDTELDFLRMQVLTSRNVRAHPLTDFFYGGLNYQIEHHLFPSMPQNKLRQAQLVVKAFCERADIPYYETSFFQAQKEVLQHLHEVSAPLREQRSGGLGIESR